MSIYEINLSFYFNTYHLNSLKMIKMTLRLPQSHLDLVCEIKIAYSFIDKQFEYIRNT